MEVTDIYSAVVEADFRNFKRYYKGNINQVHKVSYVNRDGKNNTDLFSLLMLAVSKTTNLKERLELIKFLIKQGINVNYADKAYGRNALHFLYFFINDNNNKENLSRYVFEVTKVLIKAKIDVNKTDIAGQIPLMLAICNKNIALKDMKETYRLLLNAGSQYTLHDIGGNSCIDAANAFPEERGFIDIVKKGNYIKNIEYGAFLMSKNVFENGIPVGFASREKSELEGPNGWWIFSAEDDDDYVVPENFAYVSMQTVLQFAPVFIEFYDAPYGTDLAWIYQDGKHVGFWDYNKDRETTISEIMQGK